MNADWAALDSELSRWAAAGFTAPVWWRDDDAIDTTGALDRLLDLAGAHAVPLGLAVVPAAATAALAQRLSAEPAGIRVLQHGYAHQNHAMHPERNIELGSHRPAMVVAGELGTGWLALERLFGPRALPVVVPPWNRIDAALLPILPEIGFRGVSTLGNRRRRYPVRGLHQVNVHVDIIDWRNGRVFIGEDRAIGGLIDALQHRRESAGLKGAEELEPIGMLTHHLVMTEPAWDFMHALFNQLKRTLAVSILDPGVAFADRAPPRGLSQLPCE